MNSRDFIRFLFIARCSKAELEAQLFLCQNLNYLTEKDTEIAFGLIDEIGKMLNSLIKTLESSQPTNN